MAKPGESKERAIKMATNKVNIPVVEEVGEWVTVKKAAELMKVELPSTGAIIHDGRVKAIRIGGIFLVDKASATEFGEAGEVDQPYRRSTGKAAGPGRGRSIETIPSQSSLWH